MLSFPSADLVAGGCGEKTTCRWWVKPAKTLFFFIRTKNMQIIYGILFYVSTGV